MNCPINKDYLENKMKETTERIKQISEDSIGLMVCTDIDTSITIDDLDYLLDKLNEYELFITEKNYYVKISSEG